MKSGVQDMWKRDQTVKPTNGQPETPGLPTYQPPPPVQSTAPPPEPRQIERNVVNIGKSVVIKGELNGSEDLTIDGHVEGTIDLRDNVLTIGTNGNIKAQVFAKSVVVVGVMTVMVVLRSSSDLPSPSGGQEGEGKAAFVRSGSWNPMALAVAPCSACGRTPTTRPTRRPV